MTLDLVDLETNICRAESHWQQRVYINERLEHLSDSVLQSGRLRMYVLNAPTKFKQPYGTLRGAGCDPFCATLKTADADAQLATIK